MNTQKQYYVVDQNKLREENAPEIIDLLKKSRNTRFILPEAIFIEMAKIENDEDRKKTFTKSLKMFSEYPDRIHITPSISNIVNWELGNKKPMTSIISKPYTSIIRKCLQDIHQGLETERYEQLIEYDEGIKRDYFDDIKNKDSLGGLINTLTDSFREKLKKRKLSHVEIINSIDKISPKLLCQILEQDYKFSQEKSRVFVRKKPMILRYTFSQMWLTLYWAGEGTLESFKGTSNELIDHEYVITATYFSGLFTNDKRAKKAYEDMHAILSGKVKI